MRLSNRLEEIKKVINKGNILADIGTDHGLVPISLVIENKIPSAIAMDLREGPLKKAITGIKQNGLEEKIDARLSNGLKNLKKGEADTVLIAGMGGELVISILEEANKEKKYFAEYVLSPQSDIHIFRKYLRKNGFVILNESFIEDDGKFYNIIKAINLNFFNIKNIDDLLKEEAVFAIKSYDKLDKKDIDNFYSAIANRDFYIYLNENSTEVQKYDIYSYYLIKNRDKTFFEFLDKEYNAKISLYENMKKKDATSRIEYRLQEIKKEIDLIKEIMIDK